MVSIIYLPPREVNLTKNPIETIYFKKDDLDALRPVIQTLLERSEGLKSEKDHFQVHEVSEGKHAYTLTGKSDQEKNKLLLNIKKICSKNFTDKITATLVVPKEKKSAGIISKDKSIERPDKNTRKRKQAAGDASNEDQAEEREVREMKIVHFLVASGNLFVYVKAPSGHDYIRTVLGHAGASLITEKDIERYNIEMKKGSASTVKDFFKTE